MSAKQTSYLLSHLPAFLDRFRIPISLFLQSTLGKKTSDPGREDSCQAFTLSTRKEVDFEQCVPCLPHETHAKPLAAPFPNRAASLASGRP